MDVTQTSRHRDATWPAAVVLAILAAGLAIGWALGVSGSLSTRSAVAGCAVALPVALVLALTATTRPRMAIVALVVIDVFAAALLVTAAAAPHLEPLPVALAAGLAVGGATILTGRARALDIAAGLILGYVGAASIFELTILLGHS
jgi:hypothetical protein